MTAGLISYRGSDRKRKIRTIKKDVCIVVVSKSMSLGRVTNTKSTDIRREMYTNCFLRGSGSFMRSPWRGRIR